MGLIDTVTAKYMRQNDIFADVFNYFVYDGEQVIDPDCLEELDAREIDVPYGGADGAEQPVQKTRDVIRSVVAMTDKQTAYLILAVENQASIHYAMAVKNMVYDALQYAKQVEKAAASHRQSGDYKGASGDEYLSGFMKGDYLMPVVTLVIYWDAKSWDGPRTIHEMFQNRDSKVLSLVPDYKINLIEPAMMPDEDFNKFTTTLKEVLAFIKYSRDADKLKDIINTDDNFRHLGRLEVDVLNACTKTELPMNENEEVLDVCEAIQTLNERAADERQTEVTLQLIRNLMKKRGWTLEESMDSLDISLSDQKLYRSLI